MIKELHTESKRREPPRGGAAARVMRRIRRARLPVTSMGADVATEIAAALEMSTSITMVTQW